MFCEKCGNQLADGAAFCPSCGAAVNSGATQQQQTQTTQPAGGVSAQATSTCPNCGSSNLTILSSSRAGRFFWLYFAMAAAGAAALVLAPGQTKMIGILIAGSIWGYRDWTKFKNNAIALKVRCNQCGKQSKLETQGA